MDTPPSSPGNPPAASPASSPRKRRSPLFYGCATLLALAVVVILTVAITLWWIQRPIVPVVLDAPEQAVLDAKIERLAAPAKGNLPVESAPVPGHPPTVADDSGQPPVRTDPPYQPGDRILRITERELNALLNQNTDLGPSVRIELGQDAINAHMALPLPEDFPIGGGKTFRAKARFKLSIGEGKPPMAILEDVTILGLSLPKAWLADLKGQNLLGDAMVDRQGNPLANGIRTLRVEPGQLILEVEE